MQTTSTHLHNIQNMHRKFMKTFNTCCTVFYALWLLLLTTLSGWVLNVQYVHAWNGFILFIHWFLLDSNTAALSSVLFAVQIDVSVFCLRSSNTGCTRMCFHMQMTWLFLHTFRTVCNNIFKGFTAEYDCSVCELQFLQVVEISRCACVISCLCYIILMVI